MPENDKADPKELMKLRDDLLTKLNKLEAKKETTKEKIYLKVKTEYEAKLAEIEGALEEQSEVMEARVSELREKAEGLMTERDTFADRVEELKLRFELGEFEEEEYNKILAEEESQLKDVDQKMNTVQGEIDTMKEFVKEKPAKEIEKVEAEIPAEEKPAEEKPAEEKPAEIEAKEDALVEEEITKEPEVTEVAAEEVVEEVSQPVSEEEHVESAVVEEKPTEEEFIQEKEFVDAFEPSKDKQDEKIEIAESLEESIDELLKESEVAEKTQEAQAEVDEPISSDIISEGEAIKEETSKLEGFAEDTEGLQVEHEEETSDPQFDSEEVGEGLTCSKCNFMNSKDSWYCEKCGAELVQ
ncbi:MAG: hypothetical protein E3J78_01685 [Candidatus Cloacimonadota bacterium]|nr:MAG: hypothetical protein E3J78_01685 [Candidatus Cloacimonadota bacterium]